MPARQDDDLAGRADRGGDASAALSPSRSPVLGVAVAVAVVATLVAVLTTDLSLLRGCVVVAAWAVVGAAWVAVRQATERRAAAGREQELRRAYDREMDLEDAARREYQLALENDLRRQADEALRGELERLRGQTAELTRLREQMSRISGLGDSLAGLARLREDVAALGALRGDLTSLSRLHEDVGQLGSLRDELAALRAELTEKIDAEMLVERILLRTRGFRTAERPAAAEEPAAAGADAGPAGLTWTDQPPRELTGGWPAVRLDQAPATRAYEAVGRERAWEPATVERSAATPQPARTDDRPGEGGHDHGYEGYDGGYGDRRGWDPLSDPLPDGWADDAARFDDRHEPPRHGAGRHDAPGHDVPGYEAPRYEAPRYEAPRYDDDRQDHDRHGPHAWRDEPASGSPAGATRAPVGTELPATGPLGAPAGADTADRPVPHRRRRADDAGDPPADPAHAPTAEHPAHRADRRPPLPPYGTAAPPQPDTAGHSRLSEILAESGSAPAAGGRRRRRYRDDDETDDVLSRVLRGE
jgi:hypothetical protein